MDGTILVADDDRTIRTVLTQALTRAGCKVRSTGSVNTLWRWIEEGEGDVVVSDVNFPDGDGLELLPAIKRKRSELPVVIISAQNTVMTAIRASELGAYDYLPKPFDLKDLLSKVSKALSLQGGVSAAKSSDADGRSDLPLIGSAPLMQEVYRLLARVLNTDLSVMITGESGTGKNLLANTLHQLGHRSANDFVTINASTASVDKIEGLLLGGYENRGYEPVKAGSTIYLDEIAEMSADAQLHLLDLLRSDGIQSKNLRFISSTRQTLDSLVNEGVFREDLFYRLNVVPIALPPLRDRLGDITELSQHFLQMAASNGQPLKTLSSKAIELMRAVPWNGNVRELENFINRLVVLSPDEDISESYVAQNLKQIPQVRSEVGVAANGKLSSAVESHIKRYFDLHGEVLPPPGLYNRILREVELPLIALSLSATRGNQIKTAELLGINRNTLRKKIKELDIQVTRSKKMM
ncbi:nitrogen regulation protein NR(I) [Amylibacter marinus]|uniref:DNA-binding transcriptional regulator NtrC n=1 Tax=Amylibacter marinus TaxID=1475483 RepID=A0ABQ5VT38_9RHOB|nr:sigma 54-interacting transcriptional regulator [Amylibacter marinus]GLQ34322.1 nitrogen regulation protein NR(I) [Amylibacter marinus]